MATVSLSAHHHLLLPPFRFSSSLAHFFPQNPLYIPSFPYHKTLKSKSVRTISFALAESSDSPNRSTPTRKFSSKNSRIVLFFPQTFLSSCRVIFIKILRSFQWGSIKDECGPELGETLLDISRAWEVADTSTSATLMSKLPKIVGSLNSNNKSALGKRLVSSSRRFQSMGQYGQGELQMIAKVMNKAGKLLSVSPASAAADEELKQEPRVLKFGELQVELTQEKAYIGASIAFIFGILSWQVSQGIQSIPESTLEYANDNAVLLAKSLRGFLLTIFYSSAILSAFASAGLVLLGGQLKSKDK